MESDVLVALIAGGFSVVVALLALIGRRNAKDHATVELHLGRIEGKLDAHLEAHNEAD